MKAMNDQEMVIRAQQGELEAEETQSPKKKEFVKNKTANTRKLLKSNRDIITWREQMKMMWSRKV